VSSLVETFGDDVLDSASSQVAAITSGRVRLVRQQTVGTGARPANSGTGNRDLLQHALELGAVTVVAGCQDEGEGPASPLGNEMDFGREASAGASQALAELTTSSSRATSFRSTGSTGFVPRTAPL
jgi:hypothetical protein